MLIKLIAVFLLLMLVLGAAQKWLRGWRLPGRDERSALDRLRCRTCKRILISDQPGPCGRPDCEYR